MSVEIKPAELYRDEVVELLTAESLPVSDLPGILNNFFVTINAGRVCGVAGLEIYGNYGLLRSVAVGRDWRNQGVATGLLSKIESVAAEKELEAVYLLTETAKDYFENKGYEHIARMDIPEEIKASTEFMHVCPDTATAMQKSL